MKKAYARSTPAPTSAPAEIRRTSGRTLPLNAAVTRVLSAIWPSKRDMRLAAITGAADRTARDWLALRANYSADALAALLRTEDGLQILEAVMSDARPAWWRKIKRASQLATLRSSIAKQEQAIRQLELDLGAE